MFLEVDEAEFRADPDAMLEGVQSGCEAVVIKADGRIIAALVHPHLFEQVRGMHERFDPVRAKIAEDFRGIPEEVGMATIEAALRDPKDQQALGTLRASGADYLITGDKDLLALAGKCPMVTPAAFWARHG
jgi:hypothetical protein